MSRPDDHHGHYNLGNFYLVRREIERAIAMLETTLVLATALQQWRFDSGPDEPGTRPAITLRPAKPIKGTQYYVARGTR